jgi:opacity protein-like surface antigen
MALRTLIAVVIAAAALAGAASAATTALDAQGDAQAATRTLQSLRPQAAETPTAADLAKSVLPVRDALAGAVRLPAGVAKTSVDHSFAPGRVSGSAGFVCGLQDSLDHAGAREITGYDPHGRFVGAKLSFAFR